MHESDPAGSDRVRGPTRPEPDRAWALGLVVGLLGLLVLGALLGVLDTLVRTAVVVGLLLPWRRLRGLAPADPASPAWAWYPLAIGLALALGGYDLVARVVGTEHPAALVPLLLAAPLVARGARLAVLRAVSQPAMWLDALLIALTAGYVAWEWFWEPQPAASITTTWTNVCLVVVGVLALAAAMAGARCEPQSRPALVAFAAGCGFHVVSLLTGYSPAADPGQIAPATAALGHGALLLAAYLGQVSAPARRVRRVRYRPGGPWQPTAAALLILVLDQGVSLVRTDQNEMLESLLGGSLLAVLLLRVVLAIRSLQTAHDALSHLAATDPLTGLANRSWLHHELPLLLADPDAELQALLLIDVDRFKVINDGLGHAVGDQMIVALGARLQAEVGGVPVVRLGGDEFVVPVVGRDVDVQAFAERLLHTVARPVTTEVGELRLTASIGVVATASGDDAAGLLRDADTAMYAAKDAGRDGIAWFDEALRSRIVRRQALEAGVRGLPDDTQLTLHHQLIVDARTGEVQGVEALVRWTHPTLGRVPAEELIAMAEEIGAIVGIGGWALKRAMEDLCALDALVGHQRLDLHVNVSARQLSRPRFPLELRRLLDGVGVAAGRLVLEVTETSLLHHDGPTEVVLHALRAVGVRLAVDDFGTGYSAMSYLRDLPLDLLKIDQSFIEGMRRPGGPALMLTMIDLAHHLGLVVVAEGVEDPDQREALAGMGCDLLQGHLLGRPGTLEAVVAQLERWPDPVAGGVGPDTA